MMTLSSLLIIGSCDHSTGIKKTFKYNIANIQMSRYAPSIHNISRTMCHVGVNRTPSIKKQYCGTLCNVHVLHVHKHRVDCVTPMSKHKHLVDCRSRCKENIEAEVTLSCWHSGQWQSGEVANPYNG